MVCGGVPDAIVDDDLLNETAAAFFTLGRAVTALATAGVSAPCIEVLPGDYAESVDVTLTPGTIVLGRDRGIRGSPQMIEFAPGAALKASTQAQLRRLTLRVASANEPVLVADGIAVRESTIAGGVQLTADAELSDVTVTNGFLDLNSAGTVTVSNADLVRTRVDVVETDLVMSGVRLEVEGLGVLVVSGSAVFDEVEAELSPGATCAAAIKIESGDVQFASTALLHLPCVAVRIVASGVATRVTLGRVNEQLTFSDNLIDVGLDGASTAVVDAAHVGSTSNTDRCASMCLCGDGAAEIATDDGSCTTPCRATCN